MRSPAVIVPACSAVAMSAPAAPTASQRLEIGAMAHASRRVDAAPAGSCNDCGERLQVRSLAGADARQRHDDDRSGQSAALIEQRLRADEAVAAEVEREDVAAARHLAQPLQVIVGRGFPTR